MTPEQSDHFISELRKEVAAIDATLNNGLKAMVAEQKAELKFVASEVSAIRESVTAHIAREDVLLDVLKRMANIAVAICGFTVVSLLGIIGWLLTHENPLFR